GELEFPAEASVASGAVAVVGWVFSKIAPVIFIEAFLDEFYLGRISYAVDRPDVLACNPAEAPLKCGFNQIFSLHPDQTAGERKLKVRSYDGQGNVQVFERTVVVESVDSPPQLRGGADQTVQFLTNTTP